MYEGHGEVTSRDYPTGRKMYNEKERLLNEIPVGTPKISQVTLELERMDESLASLNEVISDLADRLNSILRPETLENAGKEVGVPVIVPLASKLHSQAEDIKSAIDRINSILERCEI